MEAALKLILSKIVLHYATKYGLEPSLVYSIIYKESLKNAPDLVSGMFASRYEDGFFNRYIKGRRLNGHVPRYISNDTERKHRSTSWGYMQILGNTAREIGYRGETLVALTLPWVNIRLGCQVLARNIEKYGFFNGIRKFNGSLTDERTKLYADDVLLIQKNEDYKRWFA